jgi:hypothetical protein
MESDPDPHEMKANRKTELWMRHFFADPAPTTLPGTSPPPFSRKRTHVSTVAQQPNLREKNFSRNSVLDPTGAAFYCSGHETFRWRFIIICRIWPNFYSKFIQDSKCKEKSFH